MAMNVYHDLVAEIKSTEDVACRYFEGMVHNEVDPAAICGDPLAAALQRETAAEADWERGNSHLTKDEYVRKHTFA